MQACTEELGDIGTVILIVSNYVFWKCVCVCMCNTIYLPCSLFNTHTAHDDVLLYAIKTYNDLQLSQSGILILTITISHVPGI